MNALAEKTVGPKAPTTQSIFVGLFRAYMGLDDDQVIVYNQKWIVPNDDRLYLVVSSLGPQRPYGASAQLEDKGDKLVETVSIPSREVITVDLHSAGQAAVDRKEEVLMALASTLAQATCERWSLKIGRTPLSFADASRLLGTTRITRFHLAFPVLRTRSREMAVDYYDNFDAAVPPSPLAIES